jgi:hypothetical protein
MRDVVSAVYKGDYRIQVTFEVGKKGIVDFAKYLERGGLFERRRLFMPKPPGHLSRSG